MTQSILFYVFCCLAALAAIGILVVRDLFRAALLLLICLLSIAAIYVFAFADFIAIAQILIYAGGVVVVIIFGIMLTTKFSGIALKIDNTNVFSGLLLASLFFGVLVSTLRDRFNFSNASVRATIPATGVELMTRYSLAFELAGILLLIALIGGAVVATSTNRRPND